MRKVCIISGKRIPFARSGTKYMRKGNKELMSSALRALKDDLGLDKKEVGEIILGAVSKHAADFALARESAIEAGLAFNIPKR